LSEVLAERTFGEVNEKQAKYRQDILSSGRHLLSLIKDILDLSKVEAGWLERNAAVERGGADWDYGGANRLEGIACAWRVPPPISGSRSMPMLAAYSDELVLRLIERHHRTAFVTARALGQVL
jgi:hypothetical protein